MARLGRAGRPGRAAAGDRDGAWGAPGVLSGAGPCIRTPRSEAGASWARPIITTARRGGNTPDRIRPLRARFLPVHLGAGGAGGGKGVRVREGVRAGPGADVRDRGRTCGTGGLTCGTGGRTGRVPTGRDGDAGLRTDGRTVRGRRATPADGRAVPGDGQAVPGGGGMPSGRNASPVTGAQRRRGQGAPGGSGPAGGPPNGRERLPGTGNAA